MQYFVAVFVCALAASALARPEVNSDAASESRQRIKTAHEKCQANSATAVEEAALKNLQKGGAPPANIGPHTFCISKALGWQNEDGSINKANIEARANLIYSDTEKVKQLIDECAVAQANNEATALHLFECYRKHSPRPEGATSH